MITSLTIKNIATYDPINGVEINDLKKVNFFFGFNGSGKSTIANYLRSLSLDGASQNPTFNQCSNNGYDKTQHQILTFNDEFIEENFRRSIDFKGVFSLNQSNTTIDQQITDEETNIQNHETYINKYTSKIESIEDDKSAKTDLLLDHCWNQRTVYTTFTKIDLAHPGSKPNHLQEVRRIIQNPIGPVLSIEELKEQYQTLYEKDLREISEKVAARTYLEIRRLEVQLKNVLEEIIIGNEDVNISRLIKKLNSRSWVEQGVKLLQPTDITCPFCQKETIDAHLREQFEGYFDETYKSKISEIEKLREQYSQKSSEFIDSINAIQNVFNPNNIVSNLVISLTLLFDETLKIIGDKIEHSNERKEIISLKTQKPSLSVLIREREANNRRYRDSDTSKQNLIIDIWKHLAENCRLEILDYDSRAIKYSRIIAKFSDRKNEYISKITAARQNIETLRSQTVSTKEAVDNINMILKNAGFEGFEIDETDRVNNISRYYLKRPNNTDTNPVFDSLSEGEKNFISFLYFYQLCLGTDDLQHNGSKKKIVVIDDPVSSLDSQALFIVSTLIHSIIQRKADDKPNRQLLKNSNIVQVFVLTHNIYFYKEVSFNRRPICSDYWHYKITKMNNQTNVTGSYNKTINDDYSLMWETIKDIKATTPNNSSLNIMISNSMRRIIESYVNFVGYGRESWAALINEEQNDPSYYIKCAFISTINDESHKISALDSAYYQKIINEQPQILFDVFASIFKEIGKEHYEMMMGEQLLP